jgi:serralysin
MPAINLGTSVYDELGANGEHDPWTVNLVAGQTYEFRLHGIGTDELRDPFLRLRNPANVEVAQNDDAPAAWSNGDRTDSRIVLTAQTTGTYTLDVASFAGAADQTGDYLLTAVQHNPAGMVFTADEIAWQLVNNGANFFGRDAAAFNVGADNTLTVNITALDAHGQFLARNALQAWTNVTGINFQEVTNGGELRFDDNAAGLDAHALPVVNGSTIISADIQMSRGWLDRFGTTLNSYSFETYIHEIGHALGLGHGGNYNGSATYGQDNFYLNDSLAFTIMSYMNANNDEFVGPNTFVDASFRYMMTPQMADIIAIQLLYGDRGAHFAGNTTYGFGANTGNTAIDSAVNFGASMAMTVFDEGGVDTLNFSNYGGSQVFNLNAESFSNVLGGRMNLAIARGVTIENANGGSGADTFQLSGVAVNNVINGLGGSDTVRVTYTFNAGYTIGAGSTGANLIMQGAAGTDVFQNVEFVQFADGQIATTASLLVNQGPTNIVAGGALNASEFVGNGTMVGTLTAQDPDDTAFTYALLDSAGGRFQIHATTGRITVFNGLLLDFEQAGAHTIRARATDDTGLFVDRDFTINIGNVDPESITGDGANNTFVGGALADNLNGGGGNDTLHGGGGNDTLSGGAGADVTAGGAGNDTYVVDSLGDAVVENAGEGTDQVVALVSGYALAANVETGSVGTTAGARLDGNADGNTLFGNDGNDQLLGGGGNDAFNGGGGNDYIDGGAGVDGMGGSHGDDDYIIDNTGDTIYEFAGQGVDRALVTASGYTLNANVEIGAIITTASGITLTGNADGNTLFGNSGDDTLNGGAGADSFAAGAGDDFIDGGAGNDAMGGGAGNDSYVIASLGDHAFENAGEGTDRALVTLSGHVLDANVEIGAVITLAGARLDGNSADNTLFGWDGNDQLLGGGGSDAFNGGAGNDYIDGGVGADGMGGGLGNDDFVVGDAGDTIFEFAGQGTDRALVTVNHTLNAHVEIGAIITTASGITLTGNADGNTLFGNIGNDTLNGGGGNDAFSAGAGDDWLSGGTGNDALHGGAGNDRFVFMRGDGFDTVADFVAGDGSGDLIDLRQFGIADFAGAQTFLSQSGADVVFSFDAANQLVLKNVSLPALNASDFVFG